MWLLLLPHAPALLLWYRFVHWEVGVNAEAIKANGSADTLHEAFHAKRTAVRLGVALLIALLANLPLWVHYSHGWALLIAGAMLVLFGAYFAHVFNPALNLLRGKDEFYVSASPRAAFFPDRWIWANVVRVVTRDAWNDAELQQQRTECAADVLRILLRVFLILGLTLYAAALVALYLLRP